MRRQDRHLQRVQTLTTRVPCYAGDDHTATAVFREDGALLRVTHTCKRFARTEQDREALRIARALVPSDAISCSDAAKHIVQMYRGVVSYKITSDDAYILFLEASPAVKILRSCVETNAVHFRNSDSRLRMADGSADYMLCATVQFRRSGMFKGIVEQEFPPYKPPFCVITNYAAGCKPTIDFGGGVTARYRAGGTWTIHKMHVESRPNFTNGTDTCPLCNMRDSARHRQTAKHKERVWREVYARLARLSERLEPKHDKAG